MKVLRLVQLKNYLINLFPKIKMQIFYKIIYNPTINWFLRNFNKALFKVFPNLFMLPPSGIFTVRVGSKKLKIKTNQTNYLTKLIFWNGINSFEYTELFITLINKIDIFFDIGANIGYYSLIASAKNPKVSITSFEPARGPLYYLKENIKLNRFDNVKVESLALSNKDGEITFYEDENIKYKYLKYNLGGESNIEGKAEHKHFRENKVYSITLDNYVKKNNTAKIDLIKMDTEGTENLILEHAGYVLTQFKPIIICETLFNTIEDKLEDILSSYNYEFFNHTEIGLVKVNTIKRQEDNGVRNCFFVHPSKYHLIKEFVTK